jgi:hypothetical protein
MDYAPAVVEMVREVRLTIEKEAMPEATPVRARCLDCEYRNYCADIWPAAPVGAPMMRGLKRLKYAAVNLNAATPQLVPR